MHFRRPSNPILVAISAFLAFSFVLLHASHGRPWLAHQYGRASASSRLSGSLIDDVYNNTWGFEKIFVVGLPSRTDRRDAMLLAAALSNIEIEFIDGVLGQDVPDKALPSSPDHERLADPSVGSWRGHMNALQEVVRRNLTTALILEDDADWDVSIRDQLHDFARASHVLTQPLRGSRKSFADPTYPRRSPSADSGPYEFSFNKLPATEPPTTSPYGDHWEFLWTGHCGMRFPFADNKVIPKGRVIQTDYTVPQQRCVTNFGPNDLNEQYPNHTRVVHHAQDGVCVVGYAVTQKGARQLLYELGLKDFSAGYDILVRWFCEGTGGRNYHDCLTMQPALFQHHRPVGPLSAESDISDHGEGWRDTAFTDIIRYSVRMNAEVLIEGGNDLVDACPDE